MTKIISFLKFIFYSSIVFLIIISLFPGSLLGFLFYGDLSRQPSIIDNPFGSTINHFIFYIYISLLGFFVYMNNKNFKFFFYSLIFLAIFLEAIHLIVPYRAFQIGDLVGNVLGVLISYFLVKIYLYNKNHE